MHCELILSQVRDIMERLWENEAELCSFISDILQERLGASGNKAGYSMFFLETILVPPIKFHPPSKGQISVSSLFKKQCPLHVCNYLKNV